jgi:hypothetical protein
VQEQEKIVCLTLDLIHSLGFDEEDCLKVLRGFIRAIDGHGRSEYSARGQASHRAAGWHISDWRLHKKLRNLRSL